MYNIEYEGDVVAVCVLIFTPEAEEAGGYYRLYVEGTDCGKIARREGLWNRLINIIADDRRKHSVNKLRIVR